MMRSLLSDLLSLVPYALGIIVLGLGALGAAMQLGPGWIAAAAAFAGLAYVAIWFAGEPASSRYRPPQG